MILVPLSEESSRGEQMLNAKSFQGKGYCEIIPDNQIKDAKLFIDTLNKVYQDRFMYQDNMKNSGFKVTNNTELAEKIIKL